MSKFLNWPLESQIVMALIVVGILLLLVSGAMRNSGGIAHKGDDGYWALSWPRARWLQLAGLVCIAAVVTIAAASTKDCPKWTPAENAWNQQLGYMMAGAAWFGLIAAFAPWHGAGFKFNEKEFVATPFFGRTRIIPWAQLKDMGTDFWGAFVTFQCGAKFHVPVASVGADQLLCQIHCRTLSLVNPVAPIFDAQASDLAGKSVRVVTLRPGFNGLSDFVSDLAGRFETVSPQGIVIAMDSGERLAVPANLRSLAVRNDDLDEVDDDGVVTADCVLMVWEGDGQWVEPPRPAKATKALEVA